LTALLTLPSLLSHFTSLPPQLQSHYLLTLLRHSPLHVLRTLHSVLTPTLARDFLTLLPPELVSHVLSFLPFSTLARASRVSRAWRATIDSDPVLWRDLLQGTKIWFGGDSENAFASAIYAKRRHTEHRLMRSAPRMTPSTSIPNPLPLPHPYKYSSSLGTSHAHDGSATPSHATSHFPPMGPLLSHACSSPTAASFPPLTTIQSTYTLRLPVILFGHSRAMKVVFGRSQQAKTFWLAVRRIVQSASGISTLEDALIYLAAIRAPCGVWPS
jgi:hypothetical protein